MRRNRVIYIFLAVGLLAFSIAYQSRISAVLLIAVLCYPLLAAAAAFIASRTADAGFVNKREVHQKCEDFELWLYVRSKFIIPFAPIELQCSIPDRDTGLFSTKRIYAAVPPLGKCRISAAAMHRYRGSYVAEISRIAVCDPLRIIRISRKMAGEETLVFLPRRVDIGEISAEARSENSSNPVPLLKGEREDFSHVREYLPGDIMQLVHWKLTAKQDDLMIKQYDEATEQRTAIICDYNFEGSTAGAVMKQADALIEAALAFALSSVNSGSGVTVDLGSGMPEFGGVIRDMQDFERFYDLMSVIPSRMDTADIGTLAANVRGTGAATVILITCRLTEETILAAQTAAESIQGETVLVWLSLGGSSELEAQAQGKKFFFMPILGDIESVNK